MNNSTPPAPTSVRCRRMILKKKYWGVHAGRGNHTSKKPQPVTIKTVTETKCIPLTKDGTYINKWITPGWKEITFHDGNKIYTTPYWVEQMYTKYWEGREYYD